MPYLTVSEYKARTLLPAEYIDDVEGIQPGFTLAQLTHWSHWIDGRLRKRYAVPFVTPYPDIVCGWLARIVDLRILLRRGVDPTDAQFEAGAQQDAVDARDEIKEAATSGDNLFELPLRGDTNVPAAAINGPRAYTERSPYVSAYRHREDGREEDNSNNGTHFG